MQITTEDVKKLREVTGVGMMDAKKALQEAGSFEEAVTILRKRGHASLSKKAARAAKEGLVVSYIHAGGKVGVLLELNCETDFVARNDEFKQLANELALHVAAAAPQYISREEVPAEVLEQEKNIYLDQISAKVRPEAGKGGSASGGKDKPASMREQIVFGKLEKFYESVCLMEQPYVRDQEKKIKDLIAETVGKLGENIQIRKFARFVVGVE